MEAGLKFSSTNVFRLYHELPITNVSHVWTTNFSYDCSLQHNNLEACRLSDWRQYEEHMMGNNEDSMLPQCYYGFVSAVCYKNSGNFHLELFEYCVLGVLIYVFM